MMHQPKPITYVIDYAGDHLDRVESYVSTISEAPPYLLHLGHDTPINNSWGPMVRRGDRTVLLTPSQLRERIERITEFTEMLHSAGVEILIPYICNQTIAGDPSRRRGIWMFYDHWEDYSEFGFARKPADPTEWLAREQYGSPHYNYEKRHSAFLPLGEQRYAPCPNNPHYQVYQRAVVENIAKVGYDGVFVDNNIINCYCRYCQQGFREYLLSRYSEEELKNYFGFSDPSEIHLSTKGNALHWVKTHPTFRRFLSEAVRPVDLRRWVGSTDPSKAPIEEAGNGWLWNMSRRYLRWLNAKFPPEEIHEITSGLDPSLWGIADEKDRALWAETKLFWAASVGRNLEYIKEVGQAINGKFIIVPNWGEMQDSLSTHFREEIGHDAAAWSPYSDWIMFEESNSPGRIAPGVYLDFILQLKYSLSIGARGAILHQEGRDPATAELSYAECLSCLGSYIQPGTAFPKLRATYRKFHEKNAWLLEGWHPSEEIGLVFFFSQLHLENLKHLRLIYRITRYLLDQHIPFQIVTEKNFEGGATSLPRLLILPALSFLKEDYLQRIRKFVEDGGVCIAIDEFAQFDEKAHPRSEDKIASIIEHAGSRFLRKSSRELIPQHEISLDEARRLARPSWRAVNVPSGNNFLFMERIEAELGIEKYLKRGALTDLIATSLGYDPVVSPPFESQGIRFHTYEKGNKVAVHVVNYNVDLTLSADERRGEMMDSVQLSLNLHNHLKPTSATAFEPGSDPVPIDFRLRRKEMKMKLDGLRFYRLILIDTTQS